MNDAATTGDETCHNKIPQWMQIMMYHGIDGRNIKRSVKENKKLCLGIRPEVLEVPSDLVSQPGMFGWFKVGPKADFTQSKINVIDGGLFGVPGYIRINLAFATSQMEEIVRRFNQGI